MCRMSLLVWVWGFGDSLTVSQSVSPFGRGRGRRHDKNLALSLSLEKEFRAKLRMRSAFALGSVFVAHHHLCIMPSLAAERIRWQLRADKYHAPDESVVLKLDMAACSFDTPVPPPPTVQLGMTCSIG